MSKRQRNTIKHILKTKNQGIKIYQRKGKWFIVSLESKTRLKTRKFKNYQEAIEFYEKYLKYERSKY